MNGMFNDSSTFDENSWNFPKALKDAGYWNGIVGMYHMNGTPSSDSFDDYKILVENKDQT